MHPTHAGRPRQTRGLGIPESAGRAPWLAIGSLVLLVLACTVPFPAGVAETFMHIRAGQYLWAHGFAATDPFSYTATDHAWVEHAWLGRLTLAAVRQVGGGAGLVAWKTGVVGLTVLLVGQTARRLGARLSVLVLSWPLVLALVLGRATERPAVYTALGLAVYGAVPTRTRATPCPAHVR